METYAPFVNRRSEFATLERMLAAARAGQPGLCLVPGEAGIGKTRLLREFRAGAEGRGVECWYGQGYEDVRLPYRPIVEALLPCLDRLSELEEPDAELLKQFLHQEGPPSAEDAGRESDRHRLFLAISRACMLLARRRPTLIVVDDLHWADDSSLDLFEHLVFAVAHTSARENVPILLVGSYRAVEPDTRLARAVARFVREERCETLELVGLEEGDTHELIAGLGASRPSHQLVATIRDATGGNPLFVQEVFHHLERRGALYERGGFLAASVDADELRLPPDIASAIAARAHEVGEHCRQLLTLASFLGQSFDPLALGAVGLVGDAELRSALDEASERRLLRREGTRFQFAHPLIRQVFYTEPSELRRWQVHGQIAERLESHYAQDSELHVLEVAHHLVRAHDIADPAKVYRFARRAGEQAFALFAWAEAARFFDAALKAGEDLGGLEDAERAELHHRAGLAYNRDWDIGPCREHYEQAVEGFRLAGDEAGWAHALNDQVRGAITFGATGYGTLTEVEPLERALSSLGDRHPHLRAEILGTLADAYWTARQPERAESLSRRALELGQQSGDHRLCCKLSSGLALALMQRLRVNESLELWEIALSRAREAESLTLVGQILQRIPLTLFVLGRLDEAEATGHEALELSRTTQHWGESSLAATALASVAVIRGDFEVAEARAQEAMKLVRRSNYPWAGPVVLPALASARSLRGASQEAVDALAILIEPGQVFETPAAFQSMARRYKQLIQAQGSASAELRRELEGTTSRALPDDGYDVASVAPLCAQVEMASLLGLPEIAEHALPALALADERGVVFSSGWIFLIPRSLALAAALAERWRDAEKYFERALEVAERLGARPELGRSCLDYAQFLVTRDAERNRSRAIGLVQRAAPLFEELGMEPFLRRAGEVAASLGTELPRRQAAVEESALSTAEVELLERVASGRTHAEIAEELVLLPGSVDQHVARVFDRIGVDEPSAVESYLETYDRPREGAASHVADRESAPPLVILVTDMGGSTELLERLGDEAGRELLRTHNRIVRACIHEHFGAEVQQTGDGFLTYFFSARDAIGCAATVQRSLERYNAEHSERPIHVRIGMTAGRPLPDEGRLVGVAVNTAARVCGHADPGQILISDAVRRLAPSDGLPLVDRGLVPLKGLSVPLHLYRVEWREADQG